MTDEQYEEIMDKGEDFFNYVPLSGLTQAEAENIWVKCMVKAGFNLGFHRGIIEGYEKGRDKARGEGA